MGLRRKLLLLHILEQPEAHLFKRRDSSLLPGRAGSHVFHPDCPSEAPWSITQQAAMFSERPVNLLPPSVCLPECQPHFSSLVFPFCGLPLPRIEIIGLHSLRPGCQCGFWIEISSLVPCFPSDLPFRAPSSSSAGLPPRLWWVIIVTPASQYNDMTSMVHYLQWVSCLGALSIGYSSLLSCLSDLWIQPAPCDAHSDW